MTLDAFLDTLKTSPETVEFTDTIALIDAMYEFTPTTFKNGDLQNDAGQNNGSCKIFAFAQLQSLSPEQTLACFGHYYREEVLQQPDADNHQNIRNFMQSGWDGIQFDGTALTTKQQ